MEPHPIIESVQKRTPHSLRTWAILLIVLLFGVTVGGYLPMTPPSLQEGATIKTQTSSTSMPARKTSTSTTTSTDAKALTKGQQMFLCGKSDGSDSYLVNTTNFPGTEFSADGYYCQMLPKRVLGINGQAFEVPTPQLMLRMHTGSTMYPTANVNQRPYSYLCGGHQQYIEFTPPPTPPNNTTYGGVGCEALFN